MWVVLLLLASASCEININFQGLLSGSSTSGCNCPTTPSPARCPVRSPFVASGAESPFRDLTAVEIKAVLSYVKRALNADVESDTSLITEDLVQIVELFPPHKQQVLAFLAGTGPAPVRTARVVIHAGSVPAVKEFKVGPLPSPTFHEEIVYNGKTIPWNSRNVDGFETAAFDRILVQFAADHVDIFSESFGGWTLGPDCGSKCLTYTDTAPRGFTTDKRFTWFWFIRSTEGMYLNHVGLEVQVSHPGLDFSSWKVEQVVYNGVHFASVDAWVSAYRADRVPKIRSNLTNFESTSFSPRGHRSFTDRMAAPMHIEPEGKRYKIEGSNRVLWYDWSFEFGVRSSAGFNIWNAVFQGQRIVYELSLQDTWSAYGGTAPVQSNSAYQDPAWGLGTSFFEMKAGVECPAHATYLDITSFVGGAPKLFKNAICIFELEVGAPLRKHYETNYVDGFYWYGATASYSLVARVSSSIFNYDYILDYVFHPHGVIEARSSFAGFVQGTYYLTADLPYAVRMGQELMGTVHDHLINYKVDIDVDGVDNSFEKISIVKEVVKHPFFEQPRAQKRLVRQIIRNENESGLRFNFTSPSAWVVVNPNKKNKWGSQKGIKVQVDKMLYNIIGDEEVAKAISWSKYQLAVTKRKEHEQFSALHYGQMSPTDPILTLDDYLNGESLENTDLVLWATTGMLHIPTSEDAPSAPVAGNWVTLTIKPFNLFDEDPAMNVYSGTIVRMQDGVPVEIDSRPKATPCSPDYPSVPYDGSWKAIDK